MKNIVLFASGNGTNAENICHYFLTKTDVKVVALFCNNPQAKVIDKMQRLNIPVHIISKSELNNEALFLQQIKKYSPSLIVLAGFLLLMPNYLVKNFPNKIINIHPALLPKYGGKGMYGHHVHEAILKHGEKEHGITIHYVNENFDEGEIIFQKSFRIEEQDDINTVSKKIAQFEIKYFPEVIENLLNKI